MKRTKLMGLKTEFENLCIKEEESIDNMCSKLIHTLNEFNKLGESLSNFKIIDKF
jgi:hypothetical protein